jgi:hypothetical protein
MHQSLVSSPRAETHGFPAADRIAPQLAGALRDAAVNVTNVTAAIQPARHAAETGARHEPADRDTRKTKQMYLGSTGRQGSVIRWRTTR